MTSQESESSSQSVLERWNMPSPLLILVLCAVITGLIGSLFIIIPLAVDSWQYVSFDNNVLAPYSVVNASTEYFVTLASSEEDFTTLIHYEQVVGSDGSVTQQNTSYYLYYTYTGVWRMCDKLSGKKMRVLFYIYETYF